MKLYVVKYTSRLGGKLLSCLPAARREAAELLRDQINGERGWAGAFVEEIDVPDPVKVPPPTCAKCGAPKAYDLFKGEYCPKCNDWC